MGFNPHEECMNTHLLVTVSDDPSGLHGVRFLTSFFSVKRNVLLTLFYTAPQPPAVWSKEMNYESLSRMEEQSQQIEKKGRMALNRAKGKFVESGFSPENIELKLVFRQNTKAMDIIQEAEKGLYDAVVLGRRGLSRLEEALLQESVSKSMLCEETVAPMWICREPETGRKNVLVCVDGSEPSYRMVDHVGYILNREKRHHMTLLRILPPGGEEGESEKVFEQSRRILEENGYPLDQVSTKVVEAKGVSQAILAAGEEGKFAVIAVGRSGTGGCSLRNVFLGSVSYALFRDTRKAVLWVNQ
jgi:nucleotide-binding universal stress UspA family protein